MDRQTDGQTIRRTDGPTDGLTDGRRSLENLELVLTWFFIFPDYPECISDVLEKCITNQWTDQQTHQPMDGPTERQSLLQRCKDTFKNTKVRNFMKMLWPAFYDFEPRPKHRGQS